MKRIDITRGDLTLSVMEDDLEHYTILGYQVPKPASSGGRGRKTTTAATNSNDDK